uniref:Odorant-binding protein 6 n=1 Tax=Propsilocerus akamusi TaxID=903466 RepID=A0A7D0PB46_9DIPT|nr:odorant-binding protein 6 [Propsilocerus akamusi]
MLMGMVQECKVSEDASDSELSMLIQKKAPTTKEGKCLFSCIMEQMDVLEDGKLNKNGFMDLASTMSGGETKFMKLAEAIFTECALLNDDDRCELGVKIGACIKIGGMKRKIDFGI